MISKKNTVYSKSSIMRSTIAIIGVSFLVIISIIFAVLLNSTKNIVKAEHLLMGNKYATIFENKIDNAINYLSIVAKMLEAQAGSETADRENLQKMIFNIFESFELIDGSSIYFEPNMYDGRDAEYIGTKYGTETSGRICFYYYLDNGNTAYLPEGLEDDLEFELPLYINTKLLNSPIYTEPFVYNIDGRNIHMFTITYPMHNQENEFIGAVTVDLFLDDLYFQLQNEEIFTTGYILISSDKGYIIYSPRYQDIGQTWQDVNFNYALPSENESVAFFKTRSLITNEYSFIATVDVYIPLLDSNFYISVSAPISEIYNNMFGIMFVITLFSLLIMVILLYVLRKRIVRPIKEITENANKIATGHLDEVIQLGDIDDTDDNVITNNEIQILSSAIRKMLSEINEMQKIKLESLEFKYEKEKAEESSKAKSAFLANMSHEIRTPMNAIVGMSELSLRENDIPPVIHEHLLNIKQAAANLLTIINDILDFSKIESGKLEIIPEEYLFASLINDVLSIIRMRITETQLLFVANIDSNIPNKLIGDEIRIRQILLNLLSNAVKYTKEGFISIAIEGKREGDDTVILNIEISDTGVGIKEDDIEKLFGDFVQVDTVKNKSIEGTGLGLAIAKNICRLMGGDISVRSEYGKGSTFVITLPQKYSIYEKFAAVNEPDENRVLIYEPRLIYANSIMRTVDNLGVRYAHVSSQSRLYEELRTNTYSFIFVASFLFESTKQIADNLGLSSEIVMMIEFGEVISYANVKTITMPVHSMSVANILNDVSDDIGFNQIQETYTRFVAPTARILIVDDVATNLKVAEGLMVPYKMEIDICKSGQEAIELVKQNVYDIVFMDHMMPEMDGIEATYIIRNLEDGSGYFENLPILALTANAVSGVKEMFLQNGMNDFLAKPIDTSKLNSILEKWIPQEKRKKVDKEEEVEPETAKFEIDGIDINAGISMTGGTLERYIKTLSVFYKDGLDKIDEIRECVEKNDIHLYTTFVHAIKSASANIGANEISELAKELEIAGKNENIHFIRSNTDSFLNQLNNLLKSIFAIISNNSDERDNNEVSKDDMKILNQELEKLILALDSMDIGEINAITARLEDGNWDKETTELLDNVSQSIILFEYEEAIEIINSIRNSG